MLIDNTALNDLIELLQGQITRRKQYRENLMVDSPTLHFYRLIVHSATSPNTI